MATETSDRISKIPDHLRIRVLYEDKDCIVIDKPRNLRSVPGHAHPPPEPSNKRKRQCEEDPHDVSDISARRRTGQEAWVLAIQSFGCEATEEEDVHTVFPLSCLRRLAESKESAASVPRKYKLFRRYVERSQKRLFPLGFASEIPSITSNDDGMERQQHDTMALSTSELLDKASMEIFRRIQERQQPLLNIPEPTRLEDSAFGQLILMGYGKGGTIDIQEVSNSQSLLVVHRLDCQTSGIMVFARNEEAAASLCRDWRERNVTKEYVAAVKNWPPYHDNQLVQGTINVPLVPSEERLKWKVVPTSLEGAKPSTTVWKIRQPGTATMQQADDEGQKLECQSTSQNKNRTHVVLDLSPITGRTHQLRIHCAHVGSGILGDDLYGRDTVPVDPDRLSCLHLHAMRLEFSHPRTKEKCSYCSKPDWL